MNTLKTLSLLLVAAVLAAIPAHAQTVLLPTTLSAAISDSRTQYMSVASATGFAVGNTYLINGEVGFVKSVSGTLIGIDRGKAGTQAAGHTSGALVWIVSSAQAPLAIVSKDPIGSCTRGNEVVLPKLNPFLKTVSDCTGGRWISGPMVGTSKFRIPSPDPGATLYTGINTNGTTLSASTQYCSEVYLPHNKLITGIGVLNGTTVGTDKHLVALYDSAGNLLANSATAGVTTASASAYQEIALTAAFYAVGPQKYFACMQTNGTTDTVRMAVTGQAATILTAGITGQTFGTVPATFTVPAAFNSAVGPFVYLY